MYYRRDSIRFTTDGFDEGPWWGKTEVLHHSRMYGITNCLVYTRYTTLKYIYYVLQKKKKQVYEILFRH